MMLKKTYSSTAAFDMVMLPLSAVMLISFDVPLCAFAVGATAVPNAASIVSLSHIDTPDNAQETVPLFVPDTVKNALKVITPSFHDLGNATLN